MSGALSWGDDAIGAHCLVRGEVHRRTSPQDGKSYAIGFEMRLPAAWNGRFFYRSRPLCPYPKVARLNAGVTDLERADSFGCR